MGIDLFPVDVHDPAQVHWLRALIWPEHLDRVQTLRRAVTVAQRHRPPMLRGDALDLLPEVLVSLPPNEVACVFHTHAVYQFSVESRHQLTDVLVEAGKERVIWRFGIEPMGSATTSARCPATREPNDGPGSWRHAMTMVHG